MPIETKRYMILFEGNEYPIIMPNIYSTEKFEKEFTYSGSDLGATYTPENFKVLPKQEQQLLPAFQPA